MLTSSVRAYLRPATCTAPASRTCNVRNSSAWLPSGLLAFLSACCARACAGDWGGYLSIILFAGLPAYYLNEYLFKQAVKVRRVYLGLTS